MTTNLSSVEELLSYRISVLARLMNRQSTRYLWDCHELSLAEWRGLSLIAVLQRTTVREISDRTYSDKAQVSRAVASLTSKGLIYRERNEKDGRSGLYSITRKGLQKYREILPVGIAGNQYVLGSLSEAEQTQLMEYLDRLHDAAFSLEAEFNPAHSSEPIARDA